MKIPKITRLLVFVSVYIFCSFCLQAETQPFTIKITNHWASDKFDEPVVISLKELPVLFSVQSVTVFDQEKEIPSQLDDLDKDGTPDEIAFVLDIPAASSKEIQIELSSEENHKQYPSRVYAEMLLRGENGKHPHIKTLTVPGNSDVYNLLHHHGPAFESELVAYRVYFDRKQTVDVYGKFNKGLEIEESQFYPTDEQLARGFGDDVLRVSGSCGLGTLKGWNGKKAIHIEPVETRTETILATGPVRTVVDVIVKNWEYQGSKLNMLVRYLLYAGHRDCEVQVKFSQPLKDELFCAGIQNIKGSVSHSDKKGLLACWGTDWPVNDTVKYAKETVGLAILLPENILKEEVQDGANYLYTIGANKITSFTYHITFTSCKETFGYESPEKWFAFVDNWKKEKQTPILVQVKK